MAIPDTKGTTALVLNEARVASRMRRFVLLLGTLTLAGFALLLGASTASGSVTGTNVLYTLDLDFAQGTLGSVNHDPRNGEQLQLNESGSLFRFIWFTRNPPWPADVRSCNLVKVDTDTGAILGEYRTISEGGVCSLSWAPWESFNNGEARISVATDGSVWHARVGSGYWGDDAIALSRVTHVGLSELGQCVDRNGNGSIDTSTGLGDVRAWPGADSNVADAADECILHHVDGKAFGLLDVRNVSVDADNKLWLGDSADSYLRFDPATGAGETVTGPMPCDPSCERGRGGRQAVGLNGDLWYGSPYLYTGPGLHHLKSDGRVVGIVGDGETWPTAVAVDAAGKIWIDESYAGRVRRIDPAQGPLGCGGTGCGDGTRVGAVDLTITLPGGNIIEGTSGWMTGAQSVGGAASSGTWTVIQDATSPGRAWGKITWNTEPQGNVPAGASLTVEARAADSESGLAGQSYEAVSNGGGLSRTGRFIQVRVTFQRIAAGQSPVLSDIRIGAAANLSPNAVDDTLTTNQDTPGTTNVLANDSDPDGDTLSVTGSTNGTHGTVSCTPAGACTYTPAAGYSGADSFTDTISDGLGGTDTATVNVTVVALNRVPSAVDDTLTTNQSTPGTTNVLANDTDPDGDTLGVTGSTNGTHGMVGCTPAGACTYTPAAGYSGPDSFTYTISDGRGGADTATVNVTVAPVATGGRVSGHGTITQTSLNKVSFDVDAAGSGGSFNFDGTSARFRSSSVEHFSKTGNQASFDGTATWNRTPGYSYQVTFVDNGFPGRKDTINLVVRNPANLVVFTTGAPKILATGNVVVN